MGSAKISGAQTANKHWEGGGFSLGFEGRVLLLSHAGVALLGVLKDYHLLLLRLCGTSAVLMAFARGVELDSVGSAAVFGEEVSVIELVHRTVCTGVSCLAPPGSAETRWIHFLRSKGTFHSCSKSSI
jgi:hypothetical protein